MPDPLTPEQERLMDEAILRTLDAQDTHYGLQPRALAVMMFTWGIRPTVDQVERRLRYLADPQIEFVRAVDPATQFHAYDRPYRITAKGANHIRGA